MLMTNTFMARYHGFTLMEVLVAILIIAVGLLGLAGLQVKAQKAEMESYQRAQALLLVYDMVNRINANRGDSLKCYRVTDPDSGSPFAGGGASNSAPTCADPSGIPSDAIADNDFAAWDSVLDGAAETLSGSNVGAMIGARGCVMYDAVNDIYTVSVAWQGLYDTTVPANNCGLNLYGTETKRRVISVTLRIGDTT